MRFATNKVLVRIVPLLALLLAVAACGPVQLPPTPTAIPLEATATAQPLPTRPLPTRLPPGATATSTPEPTPTPPDGQADGQAPGTVPPGGSRISEMLARRTARDFLDRLVAGEGGAASRLYLTTGARQGEAGQLVEQLAGGDLAEARLVELRQTSPTSYEAQAALFRAGQAADEGQPLTVLLVYDAGLWLVDGIFLGNGDGQEQLSQEPAAATPTATAAPAAARGQPAAAAPGRPGLAGRLVFQVSSGGDIYAINADGSGLQRLTDGLDPAWSPDGSRIAFTRWRVPWGVYVIQADGSGEERVVDGNQFKEVAWSPDGNRLAFTINYGSSEPMEICFMGFCFTIPPFSFGNIWLADLETGELLNLPLDDRAVHSPAWSPDGQRIVYAGDSGLAWIDLDDPDNMKKGRFPGSGAWDNSPAFSPDGQQIVFMGRAHDHWEIYVMNADGSGRRQLTQGDAGEGRPTNSVAPAWSPDGERIAFVSDRQGPWRIYVMGQDGSEPAALFGQELDGLGLTYDWASERVVSWSR